MTSKLLKSYDRSRVPLYIQVASIMRHRIQSGLWSPGQKISTLEELEREFEVARVTVRQAVEVLNEEGLLEARQGRGTFVSSVKQDRHWLQLATSWSSLVTSLEDNVPETITVEKACAPPHLDEGDGRLAPKYVRLCSVQYKNGEPYSVVNLHLARAIFDMNAKRFMTAAAGIAPCSVELCEASVAVNDVKRPSQFGQERDCWSPFRSERQARPAGQEVACRR